MSTDAIFAVTRAGLDYERERMEGASRRIATANLPLATRRDALTAAGATDFAASLSASGDAGDAGEAAAAGDARRVQDPDNPLADADGTVAYPGTDLAQEMTTLMSAQRGYQADIRAFNTLHGMLLKSLTIGNH
jgi:flagellar basal-body rod protein FlgC